MFWWLARILSKLTGVENKVLWSRGKLLAASGPPPLEVFRVFVDTNLRVAFVLPKIDGTTHVLVGNIVEAERHRGYDTNGSLCFDAKVEPGAIEWKIDPDVVWVRATVLGSDGKPWVAGVYRFEDFQDQVTEEFIDDLVSRFTDAMSARRSG